ncbi:MAG: peptidase S24 [Chlamydiae bacterium]|nr:peptidase S24 [Chlamydiota bacterium]
MKKTKLHNIQEQLLELLIKNSDALLTIREMQISLGISSTSVVAHHLAQLEKRGHLKRNPHNPRDYQVLHQGPEKEIAWLNLYGLAQCGQNGTFLDNHPIDRIPIATRLLSFSSHEAFLVKARGDSMAPRINEGDFVIGRRVISIESPVMAICINNGEALIKKIQRDGNSIILISLNPVHAPFLASNDFRIVGEVRGVISREC